MPVVFLLFGALAFLGGMLVAAQGPIYARLSEGLGRKSHLAVFLGFATAVLVKGVMAVVHVVISMQSIPVLGITLFLVIGVTGNLVVAAIYDHFGAMELAERPFSLTKALGLTLDIISVENVARA